MLSRRGKSINIVRQTAKFKHMAMSDDASSVDETADDNGAMNEACFGGEATELVSILVASICDMVVTCYMTQQMW